LEAGEKEVEKEKSFFEPRLVHYTYPFSNPSPLFLSFFFSTLHSHLIKDHFLFSPKKSLV
jgi:hypothetical protein